MLAFLARMEDTVLTKWTCTRVIVRLDSKTSHVRQVRFRNNNVCSWFTIWTIGHPIFSSMLYSTYTTSFAEWILIDLKHRSHRSREWNDWDSLFNLDLRDFRRPSWPQSWQICSWCCWFLHGWTLRTFTWHKWAPYMLLYPTAEPVIHKMAAILETFNFWY